MVNTVILVHGFMDSRKRMSWMSKQLQSLGWRVLLPSLQPSNGTRTIEQLGEQLRDFVNKNTAEGERIDIIAFSMGGLVSRYYLQFLDGLGKTDRLITIATPHNGTQTARLLPLPGVKQMRPESSFLKKLNVDIDQLRQIVFVSYYSPFDLIIIPARSSVICNIECQKVFSLLHPLMIFDKKLLKELVSVLQKETSGNFSDISKSE